MTRSARCALLPAPAQILLDACRRGLGVGTATADDRTSKAPKGERHFRGFCHDRDPVEHQRIVDDKGPLAREQQHRQAACRDDDLRTRRDQGANLFHELPADSRVAGFVGECAHEAGQIYLDGPYSRHALAQAVRRHLPLVPVDEYRVDGDQAEAPRHAERASMVASPRPTTGMSTAPRISRRPGSWKWPIMKASYPARSASSALRIVCAAQRNSVSGWKRWSGGSSPCTSKSMPGAAADCNSACSRPM